jgi:hypothetical protein
MSMLPPPPPHDWHAAIIASVVKAYGRFRRPVYVEIGVDRGETMRHVSPHAAESHAVDVTFEHVHGPLGSNVNRWEESSDDFFRRVGDGRLPIAPDVVFVDGDHDGDQVTKDLWNALSIIRASGTVILHDTHPAEVQYLHWCSTAFEARLKAEADPSLTTWTIPMFPGLTLVSMRTPPLPIPGGHDAL